MVEQLFWVEKTAHGMDSCQLIQIVKMTDFNCMSEPARDSGLSFDVDGG
jgi:hypothetical protein